MSARRATAAGPTTSFPGTGDFWIAHLVGSETVFFAAHHIEYGLELWRSDGTAAGTDFDQAGGTSRTVETARFGGIGEGFGQDAVTIIQFNPDPGQTVIAVTSFGFVHAHQLGRVEPLHEHGDGRAGGRLERGRNRPIACQVRRINHIEIMESAALGRHQHIAR